MTSSPSGPLTCSPSFTKSFLQIWAIIPVAKASPITLTMVLNRSLKDNQKSFSVFVRLENTIQNLKDKHRVLRARCDVLNRLFFPFPLRQVWPPAHPQYVFSILAIHCMPLTRGKGLKPPGSVLLEMSHTTSWIVGCGEMVERLTLTYRAQSTAMMRVMSSVGRPTEVSTITMVTSPACGMPAAPILAAVAVMLWEQAQHNTVIFKETKWRNPVNNFR